MSHCHHSLKIQTKMGAKRVYVKDLDPEEKEFYLKYKRLQKEDLNYIFELPLIMQEKFIKPINAIFEQQQYFPFPLSLSITSTLEGIRIGKELLLFLRSPIIQRKHKINYLNHLTTSRRFREKLSQIEDVIILLKDDLIEHAPRTVIPYLIKYRDIKGIRELANHNHAGCLWEYEIAGNLARTKDYDFIIECIKVKPKGSLRLRYSIPFGSTKVDDIEFKKLQPIAKLILKHNPNVLGQIPFKYITEDEIVEAVGKSGTLLAIIPDNLKTQKICDAAVKKAPSALKFVPLKFYNKGLIMSKLITGKTCIKKYIRESKD